MDEWIEQYVDLHSAEGYHFAASSAVYFPYYVFTIVCNCLEYQPVTQLDTIIFKCIERGIGDVDEISFVLSLNHEIVRELLLHMESAGMLSFSENIYKLTDSGKELFQKQLKQKVSEKSFQICVNAITGGIESNIPSFYSGIIPEKSIQMEVDIVLDIKQIEESNALKEIIDRMALAKIFNIKVQKCKTISYIERYILFYLNQKGGIKFDIYDPQMQEFDLKTSTALLKKYQRKKLYSLMKAEKLIKAENHLVGQYEKKLNSRYCRNREIRELFKNVFSIAKKSILIVSPWIDHQDYVMTEDLQNKMESALRDRGVELTIGYGYKSKERMEKIIQEYYKGKRDLDREIGTELMARELQKRFQQYHNFKIIYIGTHEKILSYDEQYTIIGSFNYLSYDGGEQYGYRGKSFHFEGGVYIDDKEFAQYVKEEVFSTH